VAVRKRAVAPPSNRRARVKPKASSTDNSMEEPPAKGTDAPTPLKPVIKEVLIGLLAFPLSILGGVLMWWSSRLGGFAYWLGTASGLVGVAFGLAYARLFIESLINGELPRRALAATKGRAVTERIKVFLATVSALAGLTLLVAGFVDSHSRWSAFDPGVLDVVGILAGITLMAGGITYFWTSGRFYDR
jgi:hypothetical protein